MRKKTSLNMFYSACSENSFGANCSEICSQNCGGENGTCETVNGFCTSGCDVGYLGDRCEARK